MQHRWICCVASERELLCMKKSKRVGIRGCWYLFHRLARITNREAGKAFVDQLKYGTGVVEIDERTAEPRHLPFSEIDRRNSNVHLCL